MTHRDELIANIAGQIAAGIIVKGGNPYGDASHIDISNAAIRLANKILLMADSGEADKPEAAPEPMAESLKVQLTKALEQVAKLTAANIECSRLASVHASMRNDLERDVAGLLAALDDFDARQPMNAGSHTTLEAYKNFISTYHHLKPVL